MLCSNSIPVNIEQDYCSHQTKSLIKQVVQYDYHKRVISVAVVVAFWLEEEKNFLKKLKIQEKYAADSTVPMSFIPYLY